MIEVDASEVEEVATRVVQAGDRAVERAAGLLEDTAPRIEATAQQLVPIQEGTLRDSITHEVGPVQGGVEAVIGPEEHYGQFIEEGTSSIAPRPFMSPALDAHLEDFTDALGRVVEDL